MNNQDVLQAFLQGEKAQTNLRNIQNGYYMYKGRTLTTDGITLINYSTIIAFKENDKLYINKEKYSVTTSKIQSQLADSATNYYRNSEIEYYTDLHISQN